MSDPINDGNGVIFYNVNFGDTEPLAIEVTHARLGRVLHGEEEGLRLEGDGGILVARGACGPKVDGWLLFSAGPCGWECSRSRRLHHIGPVDVGGETGERFEELTR